MKRYALAASLLALAACQPPPAGDAAKAPEAAATKPAAETAAAAGCAASKTAQWGPAGKTYRVEMWVAGGSCQNAVATVAVSGPDGLPFYAWASPAQYLFGLNDAKDVAAMKAALADWFAGPLDDTTGSLPPWEETDSQPKRAEFPFMPREGMDKAAYEDVKKQNLPMLCFPQGMESEQCLALYGTEAGGQPMVEEIGVQLFPG